MAVPGNPLDARAGGCNALIRDGAILVRSAADVAEALAEVLGTRLAVPVPAPAAPEPAAGARPAGRSRPGCSSCSGPRRSPRTC